jgi:hypothetical protein
MFCEGAWESNLQVRIQMKESLPMNNHFDTSQRPDGFKKLCELVYEICERHELGTSRGSLLVFPAYQGEENVLEARMPQRPVMESGVSYHPGIDSSWAESAAS